MKKYQNDVWAWKHFLALLYNPNTTRNNITMDSKPPETAEPSKQIFDVVPALKPNALKVGESLSTEYYPFIFGTDGP